MIHRDAEWWLAKAKKEGDYPVEVPYSGTPCLCGERREEDCTPGDCQSARMQNARKLILNLLITVGKPLSRPKYAKYGIW